MKKLLLVSLCLLLLFSGHVYAQSRTVTGTVTGKDDGQPIPGVSIRVQGTQSGTVTGVNGKYSITIPSDNTVLIFSFIGYATQQIPVAGQSTVNVVLAGNAGQLNEVVVTGSGVATSRAKLGIAVESVSGKNLPLTPTASIDQALVGKIPGAQISSTDGTPGARTNIILRGINTIQGGTSPMILVDGVESRVTDINLLDLSNVDRIEVVQGAAASTIYGAQGANGVIQVFTKRGQQGKVQINVSSSVSANSIINNGDVHQARLHSFKTDANGNVIDNAGNIIQLDADATYPGVTWAFPAGNNPTAMSNPQNIANKQYGQNLKYYDHIDQLFKAAYTTNNSVSVSGATEKFDFNIGLSNNHQQSTIRTNGYVDRTNLTSNFGIELFKGFTLRSVTQLIYNRNTLNPIMGAGNSGALFAALNASPFYDFNQTLPDGNYPLSLNSGTVSVNGSNPFYNTHYSNNRENRVDILQNIQADYKVNRFVSLNAKYGINHSNQITNWTFLNQTGNANSNDLQTWAGSNNGADNTGELDKFTYNTTFQNFNASATIRTDFEKDFHINVPITTATLLQYDYRKNRRTEFHTYGYSLPTYPIYNFEQTSDQQVIRDYTEPFVTFGYVVNQKIDIGDYGGIAGGFRSDYSSAFGQGSKPFTFPNINGYIRPSSFGFWKNSKLGDRIPEFKLRAAYGEAGIQPGAFDRYPTLGAGNLGSNLSFTFPNSQRNPSLNVEVSKEFEAGTDINIKGFNGNWLNNFNLSLTYWKRDGNNVIYDVSVPASTGALTIRTNAIGLSSNGIQASLNFDITRSRNFNWNLTTNFSHQTSKITSIDGPPIILTSSAGSSQLVLIAGQKIGQIYGYKALTSLDYKNQAGAPYINSADYGKYEIVDGRVVEKATKAVQFTNEVYALGDPNPKFNMSFINNINYKKLSLSFQFDWVHGSHLYNQTKEWMYRDGISSDYDNPVTIDGQTAAYTAYYRSVYADYFGARNGPARNGTKDWFYEDASFVRLRNLSIAYDFASMLPNKVFRRVQLILSGRNLLTFTKYTGFDPEVSSGPNNSAFDRGVDNSSSPNLKSYQLSLNLGF